MARLSRLRARILAGTSDAGIPFADLCARLRRLGFEERIRGDHHIVSRGDVEEIVNLQRKGSKAESYPVRQVRKLPIEYRLDVDDIDPV